MRVGILPLRNTVVVPGGLLSMAVGRPGPMRLVKGAIARVEPVAVFAQRDSDCLTPLEDDVYRMGTLCLLREGEELPDGTFRFVAHGQYRVRLVDVDQQVPFLAGDVEPAGEGEVTVPSALLWRLKHEARALLLRKPSAPRVVLRLLDEVSHPGHLADILAANLLPTVEQRQEVLEMTGLTERIGHLTGVLASIRGPDDKSASKPKKLGQILPFVPRLTLQPRPEF